MLPGLPFREGWELLRDGMEESDDDADWCGLHVVAEFVDRSWVWGAVCAIELHLLPNSEQYRCKHEDCRPVLEAITTVDTRIEGRKLLQDFLLQLTPHVGKSTLDLEVYHDRSEGLSEELRLLVVNLAIHIRVLSLMLDHSNVHGEVVCENELQCLADDW